MSLDEIVGRMSYAAFLALERRRVMRNGVDRQAVGSVGRPGPWSQAIVEGRRTNRPAFFQGLDHTQEMRALFDDGGPYTAQAAHARDAAASAARHEIEFFGRRFTFGPEIDWHADPVTGRSWPQVFHYDVPIDDGRAIGDVKYVWELNRHQFLIDLGKAWWLFGDRAASSALYRIVRHWIARNPCGVGVSWACALEPAFRVWSWLWAYHFCSGDPGLDEDTHARWLGSFCEHGHFLYRHLEYYSSPYNHLIGEASALYALGMLFPEMPEAARWRERGRRVLEKRLQSQFFEDGGSVEQSAFYHHATLGFYILATLLGDRNGDSFPGAVHEAIEKGIGFSMALVQPDGRVPPIGGADDGKAIRLERLPLWDFRFFQAFGAVRYARGDFKFAAGEFFEDALWLLGPAGRDRFLALEPCVPPLAAPLPASGYFVLRSGWARDADYLCFDCGEHAAGLRRDDVVSAGHGHADCLSVILWLRGRPVLVDPGFFCYNGDPQWEVHFRRTAAHNTARIGGRDQSYHVDKMAWSGVFKPQVEAWVPGHRVSAAGGSHDGYARRAGGVTHRRAVWLHESGCCIIADQFTGGGTHDIEIGYQFAPGAARAEDSAVLYESAELAWSASAPVTARLQSGESAPDGGWIAPSLGVRVAAPRLTLRLPFVAPVTTCLTLVLPREPGGLRQSVVRAVAGGRLGIGVRRGRAVESIELASASAARSARDLIALLTIREGEGAAGALAASTLSLDSEECRP